MIPIKIECDCGQRYAFDVQPLHGRMPSPVSCPVCGAEGTDKANEAIARHNAVMSCAPSALSSKAAADRKAGLGVRLACWLAAAALIVGGGGWWWVHAQRLQAMPASASTIAALEPAVAAPPEGAGSATLKPETSAASEDGFVSLFNGHALSGWNGDPRVWSVKDGVLTGKDSVKKGEGSFLIWTNGTVADFDLRFSFRVPQANSGVAYRAKESEVRDLDVVRRSRSGVLGIQAHAVGKD